MAISPPYGYFKSRDDPKQWITDEEAAKVIFARFGIFMVLIIGKWFVGIIIVLKMKSRNFIML